MSYQVKTTLCHNDIRYIMAVLSTCTSTAAASTSTNDQCSHQNLQVKGHNNNLMTTPLILDVVVVTKHFFC